MSESAASACRITNRPTVNMPFYEFRIPYCLGIPDLVVHKKFRYGLIPQAQNTKIILMNTNSSSMLKYTLNVLFQRLLLFIFKL